MESECFRQTWQKNEALEVYQIINEIKPPKAIYKLNFSSYLYDLEKFEERENVLNEAEKLFEEQKNNFEEDIINKFEKNVLKKYYFGYINIFFIFRNI